MNISKMEKQTKINFWAEQQYHQLLLGSKWYYYPWSKDHVAAKKSEDWKVSSNSA